MARLADGQPVCHRSRGNQPAATGTLRCILYLVYFHLSQPFISYKWIEVPGEDDNHCSHLSILRICHHNPKLLGADLQQPGNWRTVAISPASQSPHDRIFTRGYIPWVATTWWCQSARGSSYIGARRWFFSPKANQIRIVVSI